MTSLMFQRFANLRLKIFGPANRRRREAVLRRERRQGVRYAASVETFMSRAGADEATRIPVRVRDISPGGIGLSASQPCDIGSLLHVDVPGGGDAFRNLLICVIHSSRALPDLWTMGCSFLRDLELDEIRPFLVSKGQ